MEKNSKPPFEAMMVRGRQLASDAKYAEAVAVFDQAIDFNTGLGRVYFERGVCYYKLGQYRRAMDDFNTAAILGCETAQIWCRHHITISDGGHENDDGDHSW